MKKPLAALILATLMVPAVVLADARTDYEANCAACHGGDAYTRAWNAKAMSVDPGKLDLAASGLDAAQMAGVIANSRGVMPSFRDILTMEQISALADYVKAMGKR